MLESVLDQIPEKVKGLIQDYMDLCEHDNSERKDDIIQAWSRKEDGEDLSIGLSAKIFVKNNQNRCEVCISFVKDKIKDSASFTWDDKQTELKFDK